MDLYLIWIVFMCAQCICIGGQCVCGFYACSVCIFIGDRGMWFFIHVQSYYKNYFFVSQNTNSCFCSLTSKEKNGICYNAW